MLGYGQTLSWLGRKRQDLGGKVDLKLLDSHFSDRASRSVWLNRVGGET